MAMSKTRKIVLIISAVVLGLVMIAVLGIAIVVSALRGNRPSIQDNSVLTLRISGALPDYVPDDPFRRIFGAQPQSLGSLLAQFRKAKVDKRISAVMLDIDMSEAGWAKSEEIRGAIADFRASGKPVYAYMEMGLNKDYYIATACDKIFVPPPGELFTIGLAADVMFFRGSLDKLGVYEAINFPGHAITDLDIKASAEKALGRKLKLSFMPWWVLRAGSPFVAMWREIVSMSYLRFEPHRLVSDRLEGIIGEVPHTPLDDAVAEALRDIGINLGRAKDAA